MANQLTRRQAQILNAIIRFIEAQGRTPSIRDIGQMVGCVSTEGVVCQLVAIEKKGFIERSSGSRSTKVLRRPDGTPVILKFVDDVQFVRLR